MNEKELTKLSEAMFKNVTHYVIHHNFKLEIYDIKNDVQFKRLVMNDDEGLDIIDDFITYMFGKIITQLIIGSADKSLKVFVKEKKELKKWRKKKVI